MPAPKKYSYTSKTIKKTVPADSKMQYTTAVKEIAKLNDSSLLIEHSRKWLENTRKLKAMHENATALIFSADIASKGAEKAFDYEYQKLRKESVFHAHFFEASFQKIKAYVIRVMVSEKKDLGKSIKGFAPHYRKHNLLPPPKKTLNELSIQSRDDLMQALKNIVELTFDAEKFKHSFGISVSKEHLGEGVLENKDRYAQDVRDEFRRLIKHMAESENLKPFVEEIINHITTIKEEVIEAAAKSNDKREKIIANLVNQTLLQVVLEERASAPFYAALANLGIFAPASDFEARSGGAETQEYEDEILHLVGQYMGVD